MRMYLLSNDGRRHLLEFLRNLTPQALLLSTAIVLFSLWRKHPDQYVYLVLVVTTSFLCLVASIANADNFLDNAFSEGAAIVLERDRLRAAFGPGGVTGWQILLYVWKEKPVTLVELVIAIVFLYSALAAMVLAAVSAAAKALQ
ncbi:hypothetical protein [Lysobacter sp. HA35]